MQLSFGVLFFLSGLSSASAIAAPVVISVCGADELTPTHVTVRRGERWNIEVIGSSPTCENGKHGDSRLQPCDRADCAQWADGKRLPPVAPTGWEKWYIRPFAFMKRVRSAHWYELTGAVGNPFRQTFAIGMKQMVTIKVDGELYLFANDAPGHYDNNYGSLRVSVTRND
jgi:hypothetical protein